jgi:hypothetical protein
VDSRYGYSNIGFSNQECHGKCEVLLPDFAVDEFLDATILCHDGVAICAEFDDVLEEPTRVDYYCIYPILTANAMELKLSTMESWWC